MFQIIDTTDKKNIGMEFDVSDFNVGDVIELHDDMELVITGVIKREDVIVIYSPNYIVNLVQIKV